MPFSQRLPALLTSFCKQTVLSKFRAKHLLQIPLLTIPLLFGTAAQAQTTGTIDVGTHGSSFSGNVRGYWFTAPRDFYITGIDVPTEASTAAFNAAIMRFPANPPAWSSTTEDYTVMCDVRNQTGAVSGISLKVSAGDIIGVLGNRGDVNSYGAAPYSTSILGSPVQLTRLGSQLPISQQAQPFSGPIFTEAGGSLSRVFLTVSSAEGTVTEEPMDLVATSGDGQVSVAFSAPSTDCADPITDYEYQLDDGSWESAGTSISPVVITGLTNGQEYSIKLRAVSGGAGPESAAVTSTPATTSTAPTDLVATPGDGQLSISFTAPADTGGADISDYEYQLDNGSWESAGTATSPVVITGLTNGQEYSIRLRAVNSVGAGDASLALQLLLGSPATEFASNEAEIRQVIVDAAQRSLNSTISANRRLVVEARDRFIQTRRQMASDGAGIASRNIVPFDINGTAEISGGDFATRGSFFQQIGSLDGTKRRLFFGDFDLQRDGETGSATATVTGKVAWEQMITQQAMLGYYIGGELAKSQLDGDFTGTQDQYGVSVGGYFVTALQENLLLDGFASLGAGRNNLEMDNGTLALESEYNTLSLTAGAALTGVIEQDGFEVLPELSFTYGKTFIGDVDFTGTAYGLVDNTLSLDAGDVSTASIMFRPEFRVPLDGRLPADSLSMFSFAPRLICERVQAIETTEDCGSGAEISFNSTSEDGMRFATVKLTADRIGDSTRSGLQIGFEHTF